MSCREQRRDRADRWRRALALAGVTVVLGAGCAGGDDAGAGPDGIDLPGATEAPEDPATDDGQPDDADPPGDDPDGPDGSEQPGTDGDVIEAADGVLSDGVWAVGDAGTVEFTVGDGGLELIDVVANDGWDVTIDEQSPDEIEVDFRQGPLEYEIEIEYEGGVLEIEIDLDIDPADPGTFEIGPAGTAELAVDGGVVELVDLSPAEGWDVVEQDTSDGEVEIELRQGNVRWELDAEVDDGQLEVEIDFEIQGAFP